MTTRLLVPSTALLWGLQFAFLNPALALLLVDRFGASAAEVGAVLAVYNASGFAASLVLPAYADRRQDYLTPMLGCGLLTLMLAGVLALVSSLPLATLGLLLLGGPAGVGSSLLFAQLKHRGASRSDVVNTRAVFSFAWVAGPPVASFIIGGFGTRAILVAIALVAVLTIGTTTALRSARSTTDDQAGPDDPAADDAPMARGRVALVVATFVALQATNSALVSVMNVYVTQKLGLDVIWAGVALGVAAGLEIPVLLLIGRLSRRFSDFELIAAGCVAGIAYYVGMAAVRGPVLLVSLQALNAVFFAVVAGVGISLFQRIIARPGLASGLYTNTRRLGAIVSGPIISLGSLGALGYRSVFVACALLTAVALGLVLVLSRPTGRAAQTG